MKIIPAHKIGCLLADREFIGKEWLKWLQSDQINARIRIKNNTLIVNSQGKGVKMKKIFRGVGFHQQQTHHSRRIIAGIKLYVAATRSLKGLVVVVSTQKSKTILTDYSRR